MTTQNLPGDRVPGAPVPRDRVPGDHSLDVDAVAPQIRDEERRLRALSSGLTIAGVASLAAGAALLTDPESRIVASAAIGTGALTLFMKRFLGQVRPMVLILTLMLSIGVTVLVDPALNNDLGAAAFYLGPVMILLAASLPRRREWVAVAYVAVLATVLIVTPAKGEISLGTPLLLMHAGIIAVATWKGMQVFLGEIDEYAADELAERSRLDLLADETLRKNRGLEEIVKERTADLADALQRKQQLVDQLLEATLTDPRTGLRNLRHWDERLPLMIGYAVETEGKLAVALIDLDRFSEVNNTWGHSVGDAVLARVGQAMREVTSDLEMLCRVGGEEFALAMPGLDAELAVKRCDEFRAAVQAIDWTGVAPGLSVTCSIGVFAAVPNALGSPPERLARDAFWMADSGMLQAKAAGRNQVILV